MTARQALQDSRRKAPGTGKRKEPVCLRVTPGGMLEPASAYYASMLRARRLRVGDLVHADLTKPRNPKHHRLVFALLQRVLDNQDGLVTIEQLLTVVKIKTGRVETIVDASSGKVFYVPQSIAFASMDQGEFSVFWTDLCRVVARDYFPGMSVDQVAELAEMMEDA